MWNNNLSEYIAVESDDAVLRFLSHHGKKKMQCIVAIVILNLEVSVEQIGWSHKDAVWREYLCDLLPCLPHVDSEENILHCILNFLVSVFCEFVDTSSIYRPLSISNCPSIRASILSIIQTFVCFSGCHSNIHSFNVVCHLILWWRQFDSPNFLANALIHQIFTSSVCK